MNVANFELCKELWELSRWETGRWYRLGGLNPNRDVPKYNLSYLLRKLPEGIELTNCNGWLISYSDFFPSRDQVAAGDTPEDAACRLAIKLFKQNILTKQAKQYESY